MADGILAQQVCPTFEQFVSYGFEEAARSYVTRLARKSQLSFLPERIGSWWDQNDEIDVLAVSDSERVLLAGECKWSIHPVGGDLLDDLKRKAQTLRAARRWDRINYILFAKSGFTPALQEQAAKEDVQLVSVEDCLM